MNDGGECQRMNYQQKSIYGVRPYGKSPNLLITPHIGGSSADVQICGTEMVAASLEAYLDGMPPPYRAEGGLI